MRASVNEHTVDRRVAAVRLASSESSWLRWGSLGALLLVILFFAIVRVRLRNMPLERDEGEFA
jgi:hypothetical protein